MSFICSCDVFYAFRRVFVGNRAVQDIPDTEKDAAGNHEGHNHIIARFLITDLPQQLIDPGKPCEDRSNLGATGLQAFSLIHQKTVRLRSTTTGTRGRMSLTPDRSLPFGARHEPHLAPSEEPSPRNHQTTCWMLEKQSMEHE